MILSRDIRRSALQALYQFDCGATTEDEEMVLDSLDGGAGDRESQKVGYDLARRVWEKHAEADEMLASLTVEWPTHRQPVVDRNLLRLGWYEISSGETPPKVARWRGAQPGQLLTWRRRSPQVRAGSFAQVRASSSTKCIPNPLIVNS